MSKKIILTMCLVGAFSVSSMATTIGECTLTGYTFMGGWGAHTNKDRDYFLADPLVYMDNGYNWWGYGWVKFGNLEDTPVASAYIVFDLLGVGGMRKKPASESDPAILYLYDPGSIDVEALGGNDDNAATLREQLQQDLTAPGVEPIATITMTSNGTYSVDIADLYNSWVAGDNHGVVFAAPDNGKASKYAGFNNANGNVPYISTVPVPEPISLLVLTSGIPWLLTLRKKH